MAQASEANSGKETGPRSAKPQYLFVLRLPPGHGAFLMRSVPESASHSRKRLTRGDGSGYLVARTLGTIGEQPHFAINQIQNETKTPYYHIVAGCRAT